MTVATALPSPAEAQKHQKLAEEDRRVQMEVRYLRNRIAKYGPASEQLTDQQLELLELQRRVRPEEVQEESEKAELQLPLRPARKEGHGHARHEHRHLQKKFGLH